MWHGLLAKIREKDEFGGEFMGIGVGGISSREKALRYSWESNSGMVMHYYLEWRLWLGKVPKAGGGMDEVR